MLQLLLFSGSRDCCYDTPTEEEKFTIALFILMTAKCSEW